MSMEVSLQTTLATDRLLLRAVELADVDLVWESSRFEGFSDGMTWDPPACKEDIVEITSRNLAHWQRGTDYVFTVCLAANKLPIGRVGIHREESLANWSIGFWIHPEHWGNGFAREAAAAVLDFGFNTLRADRITAAHATENTRSRRVIEALGFRYLKVNPIGFYKNGQPVKEYEYELRRELQ